jgi:DNA-binding MarR family transcriptional regulator
MKDNGEVLPVNQYLAAWILLKRVNDVLVKVRNRELRQYGINLEYEGTLHAVKRLGMKATPGEIAKLRCRRPHTVSQVLKNMERDELVTRNKDLSRKNMVRIALTEKGQKASPKLTKSAVVRRIFSVLSKEELGQFYAYVRMLRREAEYNFAIHFKMMLPAPYVNISEPEIDFQRVLRRTNDTLIDISNAINRTEPEKLAAGTGPGGINLVADALTAKCFSPEKLGQLSEYLEMLRNQSVPKLDTKPGAKPSPKQYATGELESALWRELRRTHDIIIRIRDKELANHGFSVKLASVLLAIKMLGKKATAREISIWRLRSASTVSDFLKRLENQGLVERLTDPEKSQHGWIVLTKKGERYLNRAMRADAGIQIFSLFSQDELDQFGTYLKAIRDRALEEFVRLNAGLD